MNARLAALASALVLSAVAGRASAVGRCLAAADEGQDLRAAQRLDEARSTFFACTQPACNAVIRADCERWIREIDDELRARAAEADVARASVVVVTPPKRNAEAPAAVHVRPAPPSSAPVPVVPIVLGSIGIAALGSFAWFEVQGHSGYAALEDGCGRTQACTGADIDPVHAQFVAAGVSLGIAAVAIAAGALLYFNRGGARASSSTALVGPRGAGFAF